MIWIFNFLIIALIIVDVLIFFRATWICDITMHDITFNRFTYTTSTQDETREIRLSQINELKVSKKFDDGKKLISVSAILDPISKDKLEQLSPVLLFVVEDNPENVHKIFKFIEMVKTEKKKIGNINSVFKKYCSPRWKNTKIYNYHEPLNSNINSVILNLKDNKNKNE